MSDINWELELNEYIRQGEPDKVDKSNAWKTAIGLQDVDGLKTSEYLLETAKEHIEGKITIIEADQRIRSYYEERRDRNEIESDAKEADIVSVRIAKLLGEKTFQFSPVEWQNIHRKLFEGVFSHAGKIRDYNITKKEWVLKGDTVMYASFDSIRDTLDYDFSQEKKFTYEGLTIEEAVRHIAKFTSDIWQIHPFGEGNTRATAVFVIKYLKTFGFNVSNETFAKNSWYFRNALVRANYNNWQNGTHATTEFLELFFDNLLLNAGHELKNRYMHIDYAAKTVTHSAKNHISKCQNGTLGLSLEELSIVNVLKNDPTATQKKIAEATGKSERTIKRRTVELQKKGLISRENGKRNGKWIVLSN
ncbi:MAG: Fic family protein [Lachnospiraceae bacterium]|nr:Fic family protein [Lachnospiraceae bacterium]